MLTLAVRENAGTGMGGQRRSRLKGEGMEFSDYREYTLGDDLRRIDWNVYARCG